MVGFGLFVIIVLLILILLAIIMATTKAKDGRVEGPFSWLILLVILIAVVWFFAKA
jgi:hypothetical protein